jgi:hypothetical protein
MELRGVPNHKARGISRQEGRGGLPRVLRCYMVGFVDGTTSVQKNQQLISGWGDAGEGREGLEVEMEVEVEEDK